jgi:hypoxanthine phosphoribosyltransferase
MQDYREYLGEILISKKELDKRVAELGKDISQDYQGKTPLLVCILRGGVLFLTDLMRQITVPHSIEFMAVSSYGTGRRESSGRARITLDLNTDIRDRDVILIEDIIDSGRTMHAILELLSARKPRSIEICTLLDKFERREVDVPIRYCGFAIPNEFVFGYGLDMDEYYRNLPFIGIVDLDRYTPEEDMDSEIKP